MKIWSLQGEGISLDITNKTILGRSQFPSDKKISHKHVEVFVLNDRLFVKDIGSANGTLVRGKRLEQDSTAELTPNDTLQIGRTVLRAHIGVATAASADAPAAAPKRAAKSKAKSSPLTNLLYVGIFVYGVSLFVSLSLPGNAYGRAIGLGFSLLLALVLAIGTLLAGLPLAAAMIRMQASITRSALFAVLLGGLSAGAYNLLINALNEQVPLSEKVLANKVRYFCMTHFDHGQCVRQVNSCPRCVVAIEKFAREKMVSNLKTAKAQAAQRQPTSEH